MADLRGLSVKVPIKFSKRAQRDLYEMCMVYKELAELRGAENAKLRELAAEAIRLMQADGPDCGLCKHYGECWTSDAMSYSPSGCVICKEARDLGIEAGYWLLSDQDINVEDASLEPKEEQ